LLWFFRMSRRVCQSYDGRKGFFALHGFFFPRHFLPCREKELTSSSKHDHSTSEKHRPVHMRRRATAGTAADARGAATQGQSRANSLDRSSRFPSRPPTRLPRTGAEAASRHGRRAASLARAQLPTAAVARACADHGGRGCCAPRGATWPSCAKRPPAPASVPRACDAHGGRGCCVQWGTAWLSCPQRPPALAVAARASAAHGGRRLGALWEAASPACPQLRCGARRRRSAGRSRDCHRTAHWQCRPSIQTRGCQKGVKNSTNRRA